MVWHGGPRLVPPFADLEDLARALKSAQLLPHVFAAQAIRHILCFLQAPEVEIWALDPQSPFRSL